MGICVVRIKRSRIFRENRRTEQHANPLFPIWITRAYDYFAS